MKCFHVLACGVMMCVIASCDKGRVSDDTAPSLKYKTATMAYKPSQLDSTVLVGYCSVTLEFSDSSGDIGWSSEEQEMYFPPMPVFPQTSYEYSDTAVIYPLLNENYRALQMNYYSEYFPSESYEPYGKDYSYVVLMERYTELQSLYERIMMAEYYSLMVDYYEGENPKVMRADVNYNSVLPPLGGYVPQGSLAKGEIVYDINLSERQNDTVSFSFVLRDRAGNMSERVYTPLFVIRRK